MLGVLGAGGLLVLILTGSRIVALLGADSLIRLGTISFGLYVVVLHFHYRLFPNKIP